MKLVPDTIEELAELLKENDLDAVIMDFELKNDNNIVRFGPEQIIINVSLICTNKNKEEILEE